MTKNIKVQLNTPKENSTLLNGGSCNSKSYGRNKNRGLKDGAHKIQKNSGFTLLEVLMVIGILAILATVVLVAINPSRQFKIARDSQRNANVSTILNAMGQNMADHSGVFTCEGVVTTLPDTQTGINSDTGFDLAPCLVPDYISALPFDPSKEGARYVNETDYDSGYFIESDAEGRVTISADGEVSNSLITATR